MSHTHIHFYDAANSRNVPSGVYAAVYINGFAWSTDEIKRMAKVFRVSVHSEAFWADKARCIDVEFGAADPAHVVPFIQRRESHGWRDGTAYVNRSNWGDVKERVDFAVSHHKIKGCLYWVATLDGTVDISGAWAVQYQGGQNSPFDKSILLGADTFHTP